MVWREHMQPLLVDVPSNVVNICYYGFTEMFNNVVEHSGAQHASIQVERKSDELSILIADSGVGIFKKLQETFQLHDPRHAPSRVV